MPTTNKSSAASRLVEARLATDQIATHPTHDSVIAAAQVIVLMAVAEELARANDIAEAAHGSRQVDLDGLVP